MAYNILVSDNLHQQGIDLLREREGFHVDVKTGLSTEDLKKVIGAYHGLVIRSATTVTADLLSHASLLKVIGRAGTGLDNVDVPEATRRGIVVMNTPGGNAEATAEHTISLIMCCPPSHCPGRGVHEGREMGEEKIPRSRNSRQDPWGDRPGESRQHSGQTGLSRA